MGVVIGVIMSVTSVKGVVGGVGCVGLSWQMVFKQDLVGVPRRYVLPLGSLRVQVVRLQAHSELGEAL